MKITLSSEALFALKKIQGKLKTTNKLIQKRFGLLANQIIIEGSPFLNSDQINRIEKNLASPEEQRKALVARLEKLASEYGEEAVLKLEKHAERLAKPKNNLPENS